MTPFYHVFLLYIYRTDKVLTVKQINLYLLHSVMYWMWCRSPNPITVDSNLDRSVGNTFHFEIFRLLRIPRSSTGFTQM